MTKGQEIVNDWYRLSAYSESTPAERDNLAARIDAAVAEPFCEDTGERATRACPVHGGDACLLIPAGVAKRTTDRIAEERKACAKVVPSSWCDALLTGPMGLSKERADKWTCADIEKLLRSVAAAIRARKES